MRKLILTGALLAAALPAWSFVAIGTHHQFDVLYSDRVDPELAPGSANPVGTMLNVDDSFDWTIAAQDGAAWTVLSDVSLFPLMAFATQESAERTGNYVLTLSFGGAEVFREEASNVRVAQVHVGTNTVNLAGGLRFDTMHLNYLLTSSVELPESAIDPANPAPVATTLAGLLPIFGTPENMSTQVIYGPVPEPATWALLLAGAGLLGWRARRQG